MTVDYSRQELLLELGEVLKVGVEEVMYSCLSLWYIFRCFVFKSTTIEQGTTVRVLANGLSVYSSSSSP